MLLLVVPTAVFMLLQLWLARALVGLRPARRCRVWRWPDCRSSSGSVCCFLSTRTGAGRSPSNIPLALLRPLLLGFSITTACTFLGIALSRIVREVNVLLPVALVAMPIDYLGAMTPIGFTQNADDAATRHWCGPSASRCRRWAACTPSASSAPATRCFWPSSSPSCSAWSLNMRGTFWGMYVLLTLTMLIVLTTGANIAALVPMGLAVLIANGPAFRLQRSEVFATLYAALLVLVLAVAFYVYSHTHFFRH